MIRTLQSGVACALVALAVLAPTRLDAQSATRLVATSDQITVRFLGTSGWSIQDLFWLPFLGGQSQYLFSSYDPARSQIGRFGAPGGVARLLAGPGDVFTIPHTFTRNEEIVFGLYAANHGSWAYSTPGGAPGRILVTATPSTTRDGTVELRWKDSRGNDLNVTVEVTGVGAPGATVTPEPGTIVLLGTGLAILGVVYLHRRRKEGAEAA